MNMVKKMEAKYGIIIEDDSFYNPFTGNDVKAYAIYTADGCRWECGLSFRGLQRECREYGDVFLSIKANTKINA